MIPQINGRAMRGTLQAIVLVRHGDDSVELFQGRLCLLIPLLTEWYPGARFEITYRP